MRLQVQNLVKKFKSGRDANQTVYAVDGVSFEIDRQSLTLLGPSGCGKTTTLRAIAGLDRPDSGEITIGDTVLSSRSVFIPPYKRKIGLVFQSFALWPHMRVFDNIAFPLRMNKTPMEEVKQKVNAVSEMLRISNLLERYPNQLSGGQQQRVAVARAVVNQPEILLLDEPLSNLDTHVRGQALADLKKLFRELNMTVVMVTHNQAEALYLSDQVAVMNEGKLIEIGEPRKMYENPKTSFVAKFFSNMNMVEGKAEQDGTISTSVGSFRAESIGDNLLGKTVSVGFRSDSIRVPAPTNSKVNVFKGEVTEMLFSGEFQDGFIRVGDLGLRLRFPPDTSVGKGQTLEMYLPPEDIAVFELVK